MQPPTYREIVARLRREGFRKVSQNGSHAKYVKGDRVVMVAGHHDGGHPKEGTWKRIKQDAGW